MDLDDRDYAGELQPWKRIVEAELKDPLIEDATRDRVVAHLRFNTRGLEAKLLRVGMDVKLQVYDLPEHARTETDIDRYLRAIANTTGLAYVRDGDLMLAERSKRP